MTKEKAKKQSDIIKELRAHAEKQNVEIKDLKDNIKAADDLADELENTNELVRGELQKAVIRADAAEVRAKKIAETGSKLIWQRDAVIARSKIVINGILCDLLDPDQIVAISAKEYTGGEES